MAVQSDLEMLIALLSTQRLTKRSCAISRSSRTALAFARQDQTTSLSVDIPRAHSTSPPVASSLGRTCKFSGREFKRIEFTPTRSELVGFLIFFFRRDAMSSANSTSLSPWSFRAAISFASFDVKVARPPAAKAAGSLASTAARLQQLGPKL